MESKNLKKKLGWTKRLKATVISIVLAVSVAVGGAAAAVILANNNNKAGGNLADNTTISTGSPFGFYQPGDFFYVNTLYDGYIALGKNVIASDGGGGSSNTVNKWGTDKNPYVIRNTNDWKTFATYVNSGTAPLSGCTAYASASYVIDTGTGVLDFGVNSAKLTPVGMNSFPFTGRFFGNLHTIKNATIGYYDTASTFYLTSTPQENLSSRNFGLFGYVTGGGVIRDLTIDSSCKLALTTWQFAPYPVVGSFISTVSGTVTLVNCTSKLNISLTSTNTDRTTYCHIGGLIGQMLSGSLSFRSCAYTGDVYFKGACATVACLDSTCKIGGLLGVVPPTSIASSIGLTVDGCYVNTKIACTYGDPNTGGVAGGTGANILLQMKNSVLYTYPDNHDYLGKAYGEEGTLCQSPNNATVIGTNGQPSYASGSYIKDCALGCFVSGGAWCLYDNWSVSANVETSNVYTCTTVEGALTQTGNRTDTENGNVGSLNDKADNNEEIQKVIITNPTNGGTAGPITAAGTLFFINYTIGDLLGAAVPVAPTSYMVGQTDTLPVPVSAPDGVIFAGWRKNSVTGELVKNLSGQTENLNLYATWNLDSSKTTKLNYDGQYGASNVTVSVKFEHLQLTRGNATISNVYWTKEGSDEKLTSGNGVDFSINEATKTYSLVFSKPTVADSGRYIMHYTLKATEAGLSKGIITSEERTQTVVLTVSPKQIYKPIFDTTVQYFYNGAEQQVKYTYNDQNTGNKADIEALYTVSGDKGTNAGEYTAVVSLVDKVNYSWVIAPTQIDGTTGSMSADHNFKWTIQKVKLGAEYEPTNIVRFYPKDNAAYFGQKASDIPFLNTSYAKYTDYTGKLVDVPGTFAWKNPDEILTNDNKYPASYAPTLTAVFTPDDTDNFEVLERGKTPVVQQLFVTVTQVKPDGTEEIVKLPVGYGSSVDFTIKDEQAGTHQDKESVTVNSTAVTGGSSTATVFEGLNGYTAAVYRTRTVGGLTNKIESTDAILKNITQNVNIYIGYTAEYVGYTVYHVKQHPNGAYASEENIVQGTTDADFAVMLVEREVYAENPVGTQIATDKKTGDRFSPLGKVKSYDGFAYNNDKTAQTVTVAGDGSTNVFIYYARQQYTVTFTARGSNVTTQTKKFYFEQELDLTGIVEPKKLNTTFAGWYFDDAYTRKVTFADNALGQPADTMGGANISLYAKFEANTYKVVFDMNSSTSGEQYTINPALILGEDGIGWNIEGLFPSDTFNWNVTGSGYEVEYDIDNLTSNKNLSLITPSAIGYSFAGWYNGTTRTTSLRVPNSSTDDVITLVAHWNPGTFTMSFNTRGGSAISAKTVTNFSTWESILPEPPTRMGYDFVAWCPSAEDADYGVNEYGPIGDTIYDTGSDKTIFSVKGFGKYYKVGNSYNVSTITLYALWESCDNYLVLGANVSGSSPLGTLTFKRGSEGITPNTGAVKIGDLITVECTPTNGYAFKNLKINGSPLSDGVLQFTVGEYNNNEITVDADFTAVNYTITYDTNGGRSGDTSVTRRYTINTAKVVLPSVMTKTGYTFAGWYYEGTNNRADKTENGELLLNKTASTTGDLSLVAHWEANEAKIFLYNAKYDGTIYDNMGEYYEVSEYGSGAIVTDMTVKITNPNRGTSLVFMGWALTRGGAVVYPAMPGENSVEYTVSPAYDPNDKNTKSDANMLYAIWSIADLDYVIMSAANNGTTYGGAGITVTARPSTDYENTYGADITLAYTWYKVLDEDKVFELKESEDIFVDADGNIVDNDYTGEKFPFTYKVLAADFTEGCGEGKKVPPFPPNGDNSVSMAPITNVNDCGTYLCVLVVTGNVAGASSATAFGEIKVEMQKAQYRSAVVKNVSLTYNYDDLKDDAIRAAVTLADGGGVLSADKRTLTLADGSVVNITYTFANASGNTESVKDAGTYLLTAHFAFAEGGDKGNYILPDDIEAELTVTPKSLGDIQYALMQGESVISTETYSADYNGSAYSVVATIRDTIGIMSTPVTEKDDVNVKLEVYKVSSSGASLVSGETVEAGSYYVMIVGLVDSDGNEVTNYQIGGSVVRQCNYKINKAKHDVSGISFEDSKVTFDNELHEIAIDGELPEGVSVSYETVFYPEDPDFVTTMHRLNNFNDTNNAGRYAGVYTITAKFKDENSNYETIADMTAELTISKANLLAFYDDGNDGATLRDGGFVGASYGYLTTANYLPHISGGILANTQYFAITYDVYWQSSQSAVETKALIASGTYEQLKTLADAEPLIRDSGYYTIVAHIAYVTTDTSLYSNNFEEVTDEEATIHIDIAVGTVESIRIEFVDGYGVDAERYLNREFLYERIKAIYVKYENNDVEAVITNRDRIETCTVSYGDKNGIPQTAFWHVGKLPITFTFYDVSVTYDFTVIEEIESVTLKYSDGTMNEARELVFNDIPEEGLDLAHKDSYTFHVLYVCTDENGDRVYRETEANIAAGGLVRGENVLTIADEEYYRFVGDGVKVSVICYKTITEAVWEYRVSGSEWKTLEDGVEGLPYVGAEYEIRVRFVGDDGQYVTAAAHTYSGLAVYNFKADDYHLEVGFTETHYNLTVRRNLAIEKVVLEFEWSGSEIEYNAAPQTVTATPTNRAASDEDKLTFMYGFTDEYGAPLTPAQVINVGIYTVRVAINGDATTLSNYTLEGSKTLSKMFAIIKANLHFTATYQEGTYAEGETYRNNPQGLRASALTADFGDGATVAGKFAFIKNYNAEDGSFELYASESEMSAELNTLGRKLFKYVYTPVDSYNYNAYIGDVELLINPQKEKTGNGSLSVEFGIGAIQFYLVNQTISTIGLDVYRIYDSYYQENGVTYGMREQLDAGTINFTVSTASGSASAHGYRITAADVKDGVITLTATATGGYNGTIRIPVTEKQPKKLTISSDSVYQTVWYVGQTFDYSGMLFDVMYDDDTFAQGLTQGAVTSDYDNVKFDSSHVGTIVVTFKFFGQTVSLELTVKEKENLQLLTDTTKTVKLAYRDGAEIPAPVLKFLVDGKEVTEIDGVEYKVSIMGAGVKLTERGEYTLRYSFTITNPRFNNLMAVTLKVIVTDIPYTCDFDAPSSEQLSKEYSGTAFVLPEAVISNVKDLDGNPVSMSHVEIVYTVNGEEYRSGMLLNVGSYKVEVTVYVDGAEILAESYVFVITCAEDYSVVVNINTIKFGGELKPEVTSTFGKDTVIYEYNTTNGSAGWTTDKPTAVGVYYVRAYIPADANGNYGRAYSEAVRFEIRQGEITGGDVDENGDNLGIIDGGEDGIAPGVSLVVEKIEDVSGINVKSQNVAQGYDVSLVDGAGNTVQPEGSITVKLLISEELRDRDDLKVYFIDENGKYTDMKATREGNYMVFSTDHLSRYVISYKTNTVPVALLVCVILGAVLAAGMVAACVVVGIKKRGME